MEYQIPITHISAFDLASCSKQITGYAIAMLIDQGRISLDDDIRKYLPEVPEFGKKILLRHLVYHTSGLLNWDEAAFSMGYPGEDIVTIDMILRMVASQRRLSFNPGDAFAYCNTNYNLLAKVVEKVTGSKFANWTKDNLFTPLGMNNTYVQDDIHKVIPQKVSSYKAGKEGFNLYPNTFSAIGSTSVNASIDDLVLWVNNIEAGKVGGKHVLDILNVSGTLNNGEKLPGGFGNFSGRHKGVKKIEHLGLVLGFRAAITRYPEQNLAVIYLSNDGNDATYSRSWQLADLFLKNLKSEPLAAKPFPDLNEMLERTKPIIPEKMGQDLKELEGIYYSEDLNVIYKIKFADGFLILDLPRIENKYLKRENPDSFSINLQNSRRQLDFQRDSRKTITGFMLTGGGSRIQFAKLTQS